MRHVQENAPQHGDLLDEWGSGSGESCYPIEGNKYVCWKYGDKGHLETCAGMFDCDCNGVCLESEGGCFVICKDNSTCTDKYSLNAECVDTGLGYSVCVKME
ncbi:MAG: hypothetical protein N2746_12315 [Deltaproteobacteria bacterium]|nr:hypothetical protein [Deltaproteobacteria bacterium]